MLLLRGSAQKKNQLHLSNFNGAGPQAWIIVHNEIFELVAISLSNVPYLGLGIICSEVLYFTNEPSTNDISAFINLRDVDFFSRFSTFQTFDIVFLC